MHETLTETFNVGTQWPLPVVAAVCLLGVAVVTMTWRNTRDLRNRRRQLSIVTLRTLTVLLFLAVFLEPVRREQRTRRVRNHVAVLVDVSRSMETPSGSGTRMDRARVFVDSLDRDRAELARGHELHLYTFGEELEPIPAGGSDAALEPRASSTRTLEALADASRAMAGKDLAGMILVSDGVDNGALRRLQRGQSKPVREVRRVLDRLDAPLHLVRTGGSSGVADLRVAELRAPGFSFVMNAGSLDAVVEVEGEPPPRLVITLFEDGHPARTERLPTVPDKRRYVVTLPFLPRRVGEHVYSVRVAPLPEEAYVANNERSVLIPAIRDRIRVLQVAGHPSYDERFLRDYLKSHSGVDLVSFFILVDREDRYRFTADETALIPFPVRELFEEELPGFDLVLFQDFENQMGGVGQYLPYLKSFVENGGALAVVGGSRSFERGAYQGTLLESILPVRLHASSGPEVLDDTRFRPVVTAEGKHHPVLRLLPDEEENAALWTELPLLEGVNRVAGLHEDAVALLVHPRLRTSAGQPQPVVSLREVGLGRTLAVTTDSLWRWSFVHAGQGGDAFPYNRFWTAAVAWLLRDSEMTPLRMVVEPATPREGDEVGVHLLVSDPSFRPAADHPFVFTVQRSEDPTTAGSEVEVLRIDDRRSGEDGKAELRFTPPGVGVYRVVAAAELGGRRLQAVRRMVVDPGTEERSRVHDREGLVELLVRHSGGRVLDDHEDAGDLDMPRPDVLLIAQERERPLWSHASVLLLAVLLLGLEWALRKRSGLP